MGEDSRVAAPRSMRPDPLSHEAGVDP